MSDLVPSFTIIFDSISFILTGNEDNQQILDELDFRPDQTIHLKLHSL